MNCSSCIRNNKTSLAEKFCVECQEYFCTLCVQMHGNFSLLANHSLLEINGVIVKNNNTNCEEEKNDSSSVTSQPLTDSPLLQLPTERCSKHPAKVIDMYCKTHDTVGCSVCFAPHYRTCDDIHYIPEIVENFFNPKDLEKSVSELTTWKEKLQSLVEACITAAKQLKKMKTTCLAALKSFRIEINEILDDLETETVEEIEHKYSELEKRLNHDRENINTALISVQTRLEQLNVNDKNKSVLFVSQSICKNLASAADILCKTVGKPTNKAKLYFKGDFSIKSYLNRVSSLGSVREQKFAFGTIKEHTTHDIKVESDEDSCNIWGTCITGDGNILLADNTNNKLKLLDKRTYKVISSCKLSASPRSLTRLGDTEAAVSLSNKVIQFVSTAETLSLTRSLQMDHNCFGLELTKSQIFISDGSHNIYVHDMDGKLLRTISHDKSGENIFSECRDITVSDDRKKIHVADSRKGLITLDFEGKVIWKYTGSELKGAYGVCTDEKGHLLVTGILSHNVLLMSQSGEKMGTIIEASDGIKSPVSVCFDRHNSRALVTRNGNYLIAFEFY